MKKLKIVLAATGVSSLACDLYLEEITRRLKEKQHKVWLIRVNPAKRVSSQDEISVYWRRPKSRLLWILYLLCPYFKDRAMSSLVAKGISKVKKPVDIVAFEIPSLTYCYQRKGNEKIVVRGWFSPHNLWRRLKIMWEVAPKDPLKKIIFMIRQAWYYFGDEHGFKKANAIVTLTPNLAFQLKDKGFKANWIPLGIDVHQLRKKSGQKKVTFGSVAYDLENPRKGIGLLLEAINLLEKELNRKRVKDTSEVAGPRVRRGETPRRWKKDKKIYQFELIGGYSPGLVKQIETLGIASNVRLLGQLNHQQVLEKLKTWDVFVFPTLFEELGLAGIEAMAAGLVCVGWKIDALEAAWSKTGLLLPKEDVQALAKTMAKLINQPKLREKLSYQTWQRAKKYFDYQVVVEQLEKVYQKIKGEQE